MTDYLTLVYADVTRHAEFQNHINALPRLIGRAQPGAKMVKTPSLSELRFYVLRGANADEEIIDRHLASINNPDFFTEYAGLGKIKILGFSALDLVKSALAKSCFTPFDLEPKPYEQKTMDALDLNNVAAYVVGKKKG